MNKIFIPVTKLKDWKQLLADPEKHWKKGCSARALAYCWQEAHGLPKDVEAVLLQVPEFDGLETLIVIPEHQVFLPGRKQPTQNDCWVLASTSKELISIAVEGKASETLGPTIGEWMKYASEGKKERLSYLCSLIGLDVSLLGNIRYHLLHRTASAIIEAQRFHAKYAVMLVHSFSQTAEGFDDYNQFVELFGVTAGTNKTVFGGKYLDVHLYLAWVSGDKRYLTR